MDEILKVVSQYVPDLKPIRWSKKWKGLCPFHTEKTPSFTVDEKRGKFHCFGCGLNGDVASCLALVLLKHEDECRLLVEKLREAEKSGDSVSIDVTLHRITAATHTLRDLRKVVKWR